MKKVSMKLNHCYGIKKLEHTFDFSKTDFRIDLIDSDLQTKDDFETKLSDLESVATEVWVSGTMDDTLFDDATINGMTVEQYLKEFIIPQKGEKLGPTARSGDIGEIFSQL